MSAAAQTRSMHDLQGILEMVDCLYAAGCGENPWQHAVARICAIGKLDGCILSMMGRSEPRPVALASYGRTCDPASDQAAPWWNLRVTSESYPTGTLFWTDRIRRGGSISCACMAVRAEVQEGYFEIYAAAESASRCPELVALLRQLAPHLSRAWRIGVTSRSMSQHNRKPSPAAPRCACDESATPARDLDGLPEAARLRAEFGLTKAEARLALCLARGWSLATAAEAFDVKLTTIRSQLQQAFCKTGTSRQAEFVAMLLRRGYASRTPSEMPAEAARAKAAFAR